VSGQRKSVEQILSQARSRLARLGPEEANQALEAGALLVDIRSDSQRDRDGLIPGARVVPRNELEWRLDPACDYGDPELANPDAQVVVFCNKGYQSSLVAATLKDMGFDRATDVDGGFQAWREAGLPVEKPPPSRREGGAL
jgi:rhodanese-related sulfurtransferase